MRWVCYATGNGDRVGLLLGEEIHGVRDVTRLVDLLGDDGERMHRAAESAVADPLEVVPAAGTALRAPIPVPPSVRDFMAFEEHVVNATARAGGRIDPDWYELPVFYFTNPAAICGPDAEVAIPPGSQRFDYELEIAAVVGRAGGDLTPDEADERIAGYMIFCDWSARDLQAREMRQHLGPAKGKDSATSLGPALVTPDEIDHLRAGHGFDLPMTVTVNGRRHGEGNWSSVYWSFPEMLSYASRGTTLRPGDVFGSGTVGRGCLLELSHLFGEREYPWLAAGDEVSLRVAELGELRARIVPSRAAAVPLRTSGRV